MLIFWRTNNQNVEAPKSPKGTPRIEKQGNRKSDSHHNNNIKKMQTLSSCRLSLLDPKLSKSKAEIEISSKRRFETTYLEVFDMLILMKVMKSQHHPLKHQQFQDCSVVSQKSELFLRKSWFSFEHNIEIRSEIHIPNRY